MILITGKDFAQFIITVSLDRQSAANSYGFSIFSMYVPHAVSLALFSVKNGNGINQRNNDN